MDAIYNVFGCKIKLFHSVFSLQYVTISTDNKIRNENPASTGSLAGSKRVFRHSISLARARTNEPAANLLHRSRHVEIDTAGLGPGFRQKSRKRVESMSQTRMNLSKTWLKTWSKTRFAARFAAG